jgi:nitrogen regulatory protein P-II 1
MKKIEAVIKVSQLQDVQDALGAIGVDGMTVCEVRGFGPQNRHTESYRGREYTLDFLPKIKIDFVVVEQDAARAVEIIIKSGKADSTGKPGNDRVLISDVEQAGRALAI